MKLKNEGKHCHKGHINPVPERAALNIFFKLTKCMKQYANQNNY